MKRILSCDGGGIGALFTLQVLKRIEALFREERREPHLLLRDEFDFFAGTSTGAIIATGLAWGMTVRQIEDLYVQHAGEMFPPRLMAEALQGLVRHGTRRQPLPRPVS